MEKNKLLIFIFSFIPGAGQMYLDMMKKGIIIMALFFLIFLGVGFLSFDLLGIFNIFLAFLPTIWFYSFFDTQNMKDFSFEYRKKCDEEFYNQFIYIFSNKFSFGEFNIIFNLKFLGGFLIFIGLMNIILLFKRYIYLILRNFDIRIANFINNIIYNIPTFVISLLIILLGFKILKNDKSINKDNYIDYNYTDNEEKK